MPSLVQNVWSSAATMACLTASFISSSLSSVRFSVPSLAIGVLPSAKYTVVDSGSASWSGVGTLST